MLILFAFIIIICVSLYLVLRFMKVREVEQENQMIQAYMGSLQSFYNMIQNRIEAVRRYRHDLAKHIQTLEMMMEQEGTDDMQEYVDNLKIRYSQIKKEEYCTDEVVNTVVSIKMQQCKEKNIPLELYIQDTDYGIIQDIDIVGILYNLLDNAIEASDRMSPEKHRRILLYMSRQENALSICTENYVGSDTDISFETSKENKDEHGIGMKIIAYLVKKYGGEIHYEVDRKRGMFVAEVKIIR